MLWIKANKGVVIASRCISARNLRLGRDGYAAEPFDIPALQRIGKAQASPLFFHHPGPPGLSLCRLDHFDQARRGDRGFGDVHAER